MLLMHSYKFVNIFSLYNEHCKIFLFLLNEAISEF